MRILISTQNNYICIVKIKSTQISLFFLLVLTFLIQTSFSVALAQSKNDTLSIQNNKFKDTLLIGRRDSIVPKNKEVDQMISFAKEFLGTPYKYSGTTPTGFDCSGFINYVVGNFGMILTRSSSGMAEYGKTVKLADVQPGDLLFFKGRSTSSVSVGHVAMVCEVTPDGNIKFIHSSTSKGVTIDTFNGSKYYVPRYLKAKRLDYGGNKYNTITEPSSK
jgi:cell wall-associated NlpC family hydrolase